MNPPATGIDIILTDGPCTPDVSYTGHPDDLPRLLAEIAVDLAEHGPRSPFWSELTPAQRQLLAGRTAA
ncbi:hypothetical protein AB0B66_40475 [Catellatospora sp. NPDC049111]|uniref:hypothetical protein n=1 Tax=Catellatospora sp. NPDC049111 TaxID=3155271 RepID=UPI0033C50286